MTHALPVCIHNYKWTKYVCIAQVSKSIVSGEIGKTTVIQVILDVAYEK